MGEFLKKPKIECNKKNSENKIESTDSKSPEKLNIHIGKLLNKE
jgi:hypothetical protein